MSALLGILVGSKHVTELSVCKSYNEELVRDHLLVSLLDQMLTRNPKNIVDDGSIPISRTLLSSSRRSEEVKQGGPIVNEPTIIIKPKYCRLSSQRQIP